MKPLFGFIGHYLKAWLDDFILYAKTEEELMQVIDNFLEIWGTKNLNFSAKTSSLFAKLVKWCDMIISEAGTNMDPRNLDGLLKVTTPKTSGEVPQFVQCAKWMVQCIPEFSARLHPLGKTFERSYTRSGGRKTTK